MFPKLCNCELKFKISAPILNHLTLLGEKLQYYFPNIKSKNYDWIRSSFLATAPTDSSFTEEEQLAEIKNDRCLQLIYEEGDLQRFWIHVLKIHSNLAEKAVQILLQFSTTYIIISFVETETELRKIYKNLPAPYLGVLQPLGLIKVRVPSLVVVG